MTNHLPHCPACKSRPEEYFINGVTITCSRDKCSLTTETYDNLIDAHKAWIELCEYFPKPVPEPNPESEGE